MARQNKHRPPILFVVVSCVLVAGVAVGWLHYGRSNPGQPSKADVALEMLRSENPDQVLRALYAPIEKDLAPGPVREATKAQVRSLLQSSRNDIARAAILACQAGRLDVVNDPGGADAVRAAIERYNAAQDKNSAETYEQFSLQGKGGRYWIGIEQRSR
jgi:hypothetical protein